jgi:asparagine synthase (glutamine-hydrolysing)
VADVPVGVFLSAGIDSATLAALAQPQHGAVHTFSVGFDAPGAADETALAAETAAMLGTRHFRTIVDDDWAAGLFTAWLKSGDRPSIDGLNTFIVSGAAKDRGITVALSGLGADEIFGGYSIFERAMKLKRLIGPLGMIPRWLRRTAASVIFSRFPEIKRAKAIEMFTRAASTAQVAVFARRMFLDDRLARLGFEPRNLGLTTDFLPPDGCDIAEGTTDSFNEISKVEMALYMRNTLLRDSDGNSMAHSVELRVPFLGKRLVDYVCSLPATVRSPPRSPPKYLLRRAMHGRLPEKIFQRPKTGFILPVNHWLQGPLRGVCESALDTLTSHPLFEGREIRKLWRELQDPGVENFYWRPLSLVVLGSYLQSLPNTPPS